MINETKFIWHKETNKYIMKGKPISLKIKGQIFISFFQYFNIAIKNNSIFMHRSIENWMQILLSNINGLHSKSATKNKYIAANCKMVQGVQVKASKWSCAIEFWHPASILKRNNICFMLRKGCFLVYDLSKVNSIKC